MKKKKVDQLSTQGIVFCEKCGVAVRKDMAIKGEKVVRTKKKLLYGMYIESEDYIYQPYYCQWCGGG